MLLKNDNTNFSLPGVHPAAGVAEPSLQTPIETSEQEVENETRPLDAFEQMLASKPRCVLPLSPEARARMREARQNPAPPTETLLADWADYCAFAAQNPDAGW